MFISSRRPMGPRNCKFQHECQRRDCHSNERRHKSKKYLPPWLYVLHRRHRMCGPGSSLWGNYHHPRGITPLPSSCLARRIRPGQQPRTLSKRTRTLGCFLFPKSEALIEQLEESLLKLGNDRVFDDYCSFCIVVNEGNF